jgi:hypothetical protein
LIFLIFFLTLSAWSFEDLDREVKEKIILSVPDFSALDKLIQDQKKSAPVNPFEMYSPPVEDMPVVKLAIRSGTLVKNPKTGKWSKIPKDIFVTGKLIKKTDLYQIFDKKKEVVFELKKEDAINVDDAVDLKPKPEKYITYEKTEINKPLDKKFSLTHSFSLNKETIDTTYFSELFKNPNDTADALKLDYKVFHKTDFPISFGIVAAFEYGDYAGSNLSGFYLGGGLKAPWRISDTFQLEAHLLFERSFFLKVNSTSISATLVQGNLEAIYKDRYFVNFSYNAGTLAANNQWIQTSAGSNEATSVGIGLGYKFNSDINL